MEQQWANRASSAEAAVTARHFARLWATPGTQLGVVAWPSTRQNRLFATWNYWWQAHLLDCLIDAQQRGEFQPVCDSCDFYASIYHRSSVYRKNGVALVSLAQFKASLG